MTKNIIAFQKGIIVTPNIGIDNRNLAMIVQAELMHFGYMLDQDALDQLGHSDAADIKDFHDEIIDYLKTMTGGQRDYRPIYSGFPTQVMEMSELELWINQLVGYWSGGSFVADEWTKTKGSAFEYVKYKMIASGTEENFQSIFTTLAKAGTSLTPNDLKVIVWFIKNYPTIVFPETIPFKENLCTIFGELIAANRDLKTVKLSKLTTTDVLRIVVHLSGGDISLPAVPPAKIKGGSSWKPTIVSNPDRENFKFKKFNRKERRFILSLLEESNLDVRDMKLKDQRWIRIGEILHPGEYKESFPRTFRAFQKIRNEKVISWYGEVQRAFNISFEVGLHKLSERAGEFMRRLDWMIRTNGKKRVEKILQVFAIIGEKSSNKVLFETYDHFEKRLDPVVNRSIMIKGARKRTPLPNLPAINGDVVDSIQATVIATLKTKFAQLEPIGDCWIDEELKKIPLPTNMRSLNDSLVPIIRGQRVPFGEGKKVIRPFIHWYDNNGTLDIDLHGYLFGTDKVTNFGYNGKHTSKIGCYSGDVRQRRGACAEYVDINVDNALEEGYKYFLMIAHNFNGGKLSDIKECVAGVMEREKPEANSTWLPSTIQNCMQLSSAARMALIAAYDLETREYIHLDLDFGTFESYVTSGQSAAFFTALTPYIQLPKLSVYDLLMWHVEARGRLVSKEIAETHFLYEDFGSSYTKTIEFMGI